MSKDVLFEIGLEELPARFIDNAERQLQEQTVSWLQNERIAFESLQTFSTPRRLAILLTNVAEEQETMEEEVRGPALKIAKDEQGSWTKAAIGFTKGQGKTTDDIYTKDIKGTTYIFVSKRTIGKKTFDLLSSFKEIILNIPFPQNMRWGSETIRYARPIRWLVALFDNEIIPFEIAQVKTGNMTEGHRFLGKPVVIEQPKDYELLLEKEYVIANPKKREQLIEQAIHDLENEKQIHVPMESSLLQEVRNLVEYPTAFMGSFEQEFLELPEEVLIISMKEHQRYFPVRSTDGKLLPHFISVRNGNDVHLDTVRKGNEKVLRARLSDGRFFYEEDRKRDLQYYQDKLQYVVFQEKLGTLKDKIERVTFIAKMIAKEVHLTEEQIEKIERAATLSKFDLMTDMVNEFTELQGIMGEKYALLANEPNEVAQAIREQYLPDHADGVLPQSSIGSIVSIADKLDTIVGCIHVGLKPTGSQDPYGLRRQAIGILRVLGNEKWDISMESLIAIPIEHYMEKDIIGMNKEELRTTTMEFMKQRMTYILKQLSIETDVIHAVIDQEIGILTYTKEKAILLSSKRNDMTFKTIQESLVRVMNLAGKSEVGVVDPTLLQTPSEQELYEQYQIVKSEFQQHNNNQDAVSALNALSKLAQPIESFFDHNMVMDKDEQLKNNRLALLYVISTLIQSFANLSMIEWKQHF